MPRVPFVIPSLIELPEFPGVTLIPCYIPAYVDRLRSSGAPSATTDVSMIEFDKVDSYQTTGPTTDFNTIGGVTK
jgi:hypothetical protein